LPLALGTTLETTPAKVPYLMVPEQALRDAASRPWPQVGMRVGLVWAGEPTHLNDRFRSLPLSLLEPLMNVPDVHFFSLQLGPAASQLESNPFPITDLAPAISDFADTAALMANLDLIISVDTAVVHLAGALAKPTCVLLPSSPDWRWMLRRRDNPWYPSVRLFRQQTLGDWQPAIQEVCLLLRSIAVRGHGIRP